jgi:hypothetical protein
VDSNSLARAVNPLAARLQIHSGSAWGSSGRRAGSLLKWLRALYSALPRRDDRARFSLRIADAQGQQVVALEDGAPLTVVFLHAGTYHVDARQDNVRRRYTMTLEQGASFDLYLDLAPDRP